jgi:hypothetical protein
MNSRGAKAVKEDSHHKPWLVRVLDWLRHESLRRTVVIAILVVALVPVILVGAVSYFRTRAQIQSLVANQLYQITNSSAKQLEDFAQTRSTLLTRLTSDPAFLVTLQASLDPNTVLSEQTAAALNIRTQLYNQAQGVASSEPIFSQLFVVDQNARLVASSDSQFIFDNFVASRVTHPAVKPLIQKTTSTSAYNPFNNTRNGLVLLTSQTFSLKGNDLQFTIIGVSPTLLYSRALEQATAFLPGARAFFVDTGGKVMQPGKDIALEILPPSEPFNQAVDPVINGNQTIQPITYDSYDEEVVLGYVQSIPSTTFHSSYRCPPRNCTARCRCWMGPAC